MWLVIGNLCIGDQKEPGSIIPLGDIATCDLLPSLSSHALAATLIGLERMFCGFTAILITGNHMVWDNPGDNSRSPDTLNYRF